MNKKSNIFNFKPKKYLGQNFLKNKKNAFKIVSYLEIADNEIIIEIGAGKGELTKIILEKASLKKSTKVIAIEKDKILCKILKERFKNYSNFEILNCDILKINPKKLGLRNNNYKIIGNIPYYLTGKLLQELLENWPKPKKIILMLQKEVALKITATEKRSFLTNITQLLANTKILMKVDKKNFYPQPKIDSMVVEFIPYFKKQKGFKKLKRVLKAGFSHPRKYLITNLEKELNLNKIDILKIFEKLNLDPKIRAENLKLEDWQLLTNHLDFML
jgi:16S rRNA (adenine1518-N6/adenine1519-N6)-dimethyltransferase